MTHAWADTDAVLNRWDHEQEFYPSGIEKWTIHDFVARIFHGWDLLTVHWADDAAAAVIQIRDHCTVIPFCWPHTLLTGEDPTIPVSAWVVSETDASRTGLGYRATFFDSALSDSLNGSLSDRSC